MMVVSKNRILVEFCNLKAATSFETYEQKISKVAEKIGVSVEAVDITVSEYISQCNQLNFLVKGSNDVTYIY